MIDLFGHLIMRLWCETVCLFLWNLQNLPSTVPADMGEDDYLNSACILRYHKCHHKVLQDKKNTVCFQLLFLGALQNVISLFFADFLKMRERFIETQLKVLVKLRAEHLHFYDD